MFMRMLFYLKNQYLPDNEEWDLIEDILQKDRFTFEAISDSLKVFSKSIKEVENVSLKNKVLLGFGYQQQQKYLDVTKMCMEKNLPGQFEEWMYRESRIKKQIIFNYKNLYKLMRIALKLMNCRVSMTYLVKNHQILINHFEENKEQPWKHNFSCNCETFNSYFTEQTMRSWGYVK